jgi:hypothetical protein
MTEPVDPVQRLLPSPHAEADREDRTTYVVCRVIGYGGERPTTEREEWRRVRELCDWKAARPAHLPAPSGTLTLTTQGAASEGWPTTTASRTEGEMLGMASSRCRPGEPT